MDTCVTIAIIGLTQLQTLGIKTIVCGLYTNVKFFENASEPISDTADVYIVSGEEFISRIHFYLPRKDRVLLLTAAPGGVSDGIKVIPLSSSIEEIEHALCVLVDNVVRVQCAEEKNVGLSSRETDVLRLLAQGKTIKEIATELYISVNTVLTHRKNISAKLNIRSVSGLSLYAMMNGIL